MREKLAKKFDLNQREKYKATFERFGKKAGYKGDIKTILLIDVVDQLHKIVASHLWMDCGKQFEKLDLKEGDMIQFFARPKVYEKGYRGHNGLEEEGYQTIDYGLCYPSRATRLTQKYIINTN